MCESWGGQQQKVEQDSNFRWDVKVKSTHTCTGDYHNPIWALCRLFDRNLIKISIQKDLTPANLATSLIIKTI